jgi:anti-sigma B factor antagonist
VSATWTIATSADGVRRVAVRGELDLDAEDRFFRAVDELLSSGDTSVVLDLGGLEFIDSSGVRALLRLHLAHGERVQLGELSDSVARVLDIVGALPRLRGEPEPLP